MNLTEIGCLLFGVGRGRVKRIATASFWHLAFRHQRRPMGTGRLVRSRRSRPASYEDWKNVLPDAFASGLPDSWVPATLQARRGVPRGVRCRQGKRHNIWRAAPTTSPWGTEVTLSLVVGAGGRPSRLLLCEGHLAQGVGSEKANGILGGAQHHYLALRSDSEIPPDSVVPQAWFHGTKRHCANVFIVQFLFFAMPKDRAGLKDLSPALHKGKKRNANLRVCTVRVSCIL